MMIKAECFMASSRALFATALLIAAGCGSTGSGSAAHRAPVVPVAATKSETSMAAPAMKFRSADIEAALKKAYAMHRELADGKNADHIPGLAKVDPKLFGIAMVTVDGTVFEVGDSKHPFAIESSANPFVLARVMQEIGAKAVEDKIGVNASGMPFNSIIAIDLHHDTPAMNPLINAGAIATVSYLQAGSPDERLGKVVGTLSDFAGHTLALNMEIYRAEAETNGRNKAIAWLLKSNDVLQGEPDEMLDVYTKGCSVDVTAKDLATMGATLANGGLNPVTRKRVVDADVAEHVLSVMSTAGMSDTTGAWMYRVGLPSSSGVAGGIVAVQPGAFAIAAFSPPLDKPGHSVRGQRAIEMIADDLHAGVFNVPKGK